MLRLTDTIAAIATPPGEGGIGIVRVSGPKSLEIADTLFHTSAGRASQLPTHSIHYGLLADPIQNPKSKIQNRIDDALLLLFRAPHSYTGEDVVEFSCHGGSVTLGRALAATLKCGARLAEPGEFTQRAFLNGRMDLAQAEAVCDQINARTEAAQRLALTQREGLLSQRIRDLKNEVVGALAAVEVTIDFSEEVGDLDYGALAARLIGIRSDLEKLIATAEQGRVYREGIRLAIVGRPNVGKSSLLNAILRENRAIVTPIAGTTRDVIEETANIKGIPLTAIDTAGIRETEDVVERIGVDRARAAVESASLILFVMDSSEGWTQEDAQILHAIRDRKIVVAANKIDLVGPAATPSPVGTAECSPAIPLPGNAAIMDAGPRVVPVSATTGAGLEQLESTLAESILGGGLAESPSAIVSNVRHLHALESAHQSIVQAEQTTAEAMPPDFISIDLRGALDSLGLITGETATDEIIHRIFHDFCVGK